MMFSFIAYSFRKGVSLMMFSFVLLMLQNKLDELKKEQDGAEEKKNDLEGLSNLSTPSHFQLPLSFIIKKKKFWSAVAQW